MHQVDPLLGRFHHFPLQLPLPWILRCPRRTRASAQNWLAPRPARHFHHQGDEDQGLRAIVGVLQQFGIVDHVPIIWGIRWIPRQVHLVLIDCIFINTPISACSELSRFIAAGRLNCVIDKVDGVVLTNKVDLRTEQYQAVLKHGDQIINKLQKLGRVISY